MKINAHMIDRAMDAAFEQGLIQDGSADSRAKVEAILTAGLEGIGFNGLVDIAKMILDAHYPASIFTGVSGDPGPVFVAQLREALAVLPTTH